MNDLLIIYSEEEVVSVSEYIEGTVIATHLNYIKTSKESGLIMLRALGVKNTTKLENFEITQQ